MMTSRWGLIVLALQFAAPQALHEPSIARGLGRRAVFCAVASGLCLHPKGAVLADTGLGYVDAAGMRSYSSVQRAWEKSATMSNREIMLAARGAGKANVQDGGETEKSKKRRAMAGCKDATFRAAAGYQDEASCNARVLGGDAAFMLEVMDTEQ